MSESASEQAASVEEVSASVEQMGASISQISENSQEVVAFFRLASNSTMNSASDRTPVSKRQTATGLGTDSEFDETKFKIFSA